MTTKDLLKERGVTLSDKSVAKCANMSLADFRARNASFQQELRDDVETVTLFMLNNGLPMTESDYRRAAKLVHDAKQEEAFVRAWREGMSNQILAACYK